MMIQYLMLDIHYIQNECLKCNPHSTYGLLLYSMSCIEAKVHTFHPTVKSFVS